MRSQLLVVSGRTVNQKQLRFIPRNLPAVNLSAHLVATTANVAVCRTSTARQANCVFLLLPLHLPEISAPTCLSACLSDCQSVKTKEMSEWCIVRLPVCLSLIKK